MTCILYVKRHKVLCEAWGDDIRVTESNHCVFVDLFAGLVQSQNKQKWVLHS